MLQLNSISSLQAAFKCQVLTFMKFQTEGAVVLHVNVSRPVVSPEATEIPQTTAKSCSACDSSRVMLKKQPDAAGINEVWEIKHTVFALHTQEESSSKTP